MLSEKKPGQEADESKTEKVFTLDTKETIRQYQDIIMEISDDIIELTEEIIEVIKNGTKKTINDKNSYHFDRSYFESFGANGFRDYFRQLAFMECAGVIS